MTWTMHTVLRKILIWTGLLLLEGSRSRSEEFPPKITDHPSDLVLRRDQPATLNCRAVGNPIPVIEWYRNGEYVKTSKDDRVSQPTLLPDGSLFFLHVSQKKGKSDEGVYTCLARNHLGVATSKNASLYVEALQEEFRLQPSSTEVTEGDQLLLECAPPRGHPEPSISWKKNGISISDENGHYEISSTRLLVAHALKSDSGAYVCIASNQAGERTSRVALVSVLEKPKFTRRPNDVVARQGSNVQFVCGVHGDPKPTVWWQKENGELPPGRYEISQENTLQLLHLMANDAGKYICTARNQADTIVAKATLVVQDPRDTGQKGKDYLDDAHQELRDVQVSLMNATALPSAMGAYLHWKVVPSSKHLEVYIIFYRSLLPVNSSWAEWNVTKDHHTVVPRLKRGYKYEFTVQPCMEKICGSESNRRQLWIPEEVPGAAPERVSLTTFQDGNGTAVIHWEPPPQNFHNGVINGYQVWFLHNETHHGSNRTVDGKTHRLEVSGLSSQLKYCVQVAAINGAGIGMASYPVCSAADPLVDKMAKSNDFASGNFILDVLRQPIFIASVGSALWIMLMVLAVYVCQQQARQYRRERHYTFGEGLYRNASDDTIIKHRIDSSGSPWLSNTWKSSDSKTYSTNSSLSSQLLWADSKENPQTHKPTMPFERQSQGSNIQTVPLVTDSSSLYGAFRVDLPVKDLKTFSGSSGSNLSSPSLHIVEVAQSGERRAVPSYSQHPGVPTTNTRGGVRTELWKAAHPAASPSPVMVQETWDKAIKKELEQMHSSPVLPSHFPVDRSNNGSQATSISLGKHPRIPGVTKKVLKTYSSPKFSHWGTSQNMDGWLPPPPPLPPDLQVPQDHSISKECTCTCYLNPPVDQIFQQQDKESLPAASESAEESRASPMLPYGHLSSASVSGSFNDDGETVLTPEEVAEYLELSEEAGCQRRQSDSVPAPSQVFSLPHTYGYICGPLASELLEDDAMDEEEEEEEEGGDADGHSDTIEGCCSSSKLFRRFCRTPPSSLSEDDTSWAGSLLNGWGSVSEDNGTSTRCSFVSSSDGSFFVDANFAQALAVAVDSFCLGLSQRDLDQVLTGAAVSDFAEPPEGASGALQDFGSGAFAIPGRGEKSIAEKLAVRGQGEEEESAAEKSRPKI